MPVIIPNLPDASFADQAEPDSGDFQILSAADGVISGGVVTAQGSPNMTVHVTAVKAEIGGNVYSYAAADPVITPADSDPRFDLVVVNTTGIAVVRGTASTNPRFPVIPASTVVLATVFVPAGTGSITTSRVLDKSMVLAATFRRAHASAATTFISSRVGADATDRFTVRADGGLTWQNGEVSLSDVGSEAMEFAGQWRVKPNENSQIPVRIQTHATQSADALEIVNSGLSVLASFDAVGRFRAPNFFPGTGSPEGVRNGVLGDVFQRTDGGVNSSLYVKTSNSGGNTGWEPLQSFVVTAPSTPIGAVMAFAGAAAPTSFLICDGALISTSTYADLFAVLGYAHGGAGGQFRLPDLRGRAPIGAGTGAGLTNRSLAETGGAESVALSIGNLPSHTHPGGSHSHNVSGGIADGGVTGGGGGHDHGTHFHYLNLGVLDVATTVCGNRAGLNTIYAVRKFGGPVSESDPDWLPVGFGVVHPEAVSTVTNHTHALSDTSPVADVPGSFNTGATGSGSAHDNMPPWLGLNYIIRYE